MSIGESVSSPQRRPLHTRNRLSLKLAGASLYASAFVFLGLGAMSLIAPTVLASLVEIVLPTAVAIMEVRGVYGGLFFGIGCFFLLLALLGTNAVSEGKGRPRFRTRAADADEAGGGDIYMIVSCTQKTPR